MDKEAKEHSSRFTQIAFPMTTRPVWRTAKNMYICLLCSVSNYASGLLTTTLVCSEAKLCPCIQFSYLNPIFEKKTHLLPV